VNSEGLRELFALCPQGSLSAFAIVPLGANRNSLPEKAQLSSDSQNHEKKFDLTAIFRFLSLAFAPRS